jgi:phosphoserine phosphatase RsbX
VTSSSGWAHRTVAAKDDWPLDWGAAGRARPGESTTGDRAVVAFTFGRAVAAAVDGLGHGPAAANAAKKAVSVVERYPRDDVVSLAERCNGELRDGRGVAMSLASFDLRKGEMSWLGIGNVEGRLIPAGAYAADGRSLLLRPGVVGDQLPALSADTVSVSRGDVLILATDGVTSEFGDYLHPSRSCQETAQLILDRYGKPTDDALVLVARYVAEAA